MTVEEAIEIVLELARQNIIDDIDSHHHPEEHNRQTEACDIIHDFAVNVIHK